MMAEGIGIFSGAFHVQQNVKSFKAFLILKKVFFFPECMYAKLPYLKGSVKQLVAVTNDITIIEFVGKLAKLHWKRLVG